MELDAVLLSRVQFGFTLAFHILFPTLTIGLSIFLVILEGGWLRTGDEAYLRLYRFWVKIFALGFGMGVVSGVVLSFQVGTNWSIFSHAGGNLLGPLLTYEVLMAFFLEASFLPIVLFGWGRVSPRLHFFATIMVALGTVLSAFWILAANSWMHTPTGYRLEDGIFFVESWWEVIFNPSFPYRFAHMLFASLLTSAFVIAGVSAWHLLRSHNSEVSRRAFSSAMSMAIVLAPLQIVLGDLHGLQVQRDQPMKVAAMEGLWETSEAVPFLLFAVPDMARETNHYEIGIPKLASIILQHHPQGRVLGLNEVAPEDRPHVPIVFFSFRVMLAIGFWLLALAVAGLVLRLRGQLYSRPMFLRLCVWSMPLGFIAVIAGWLVTEVGRQPWIVQDLVRTVDAATPLPAASVLGSLVLFFVVYNVLLFAFLYFAWRIVRKGLEDAPARLAEEVPRTAWYPPQ
jgi:cytochrome bd ubiquinol oxidase subunit I